MYGPHSNNNVIPAAPGVAKVTKDTVVKKDTIVNKDTIPDHSAFKIKLVKDSTSSDETMLTFNHLGSRIYSANNDAPYLQGFGQVSLASVSRDGVDLAIVNIFDNTVSVLLNRCQ